MELPADILVKSTAVSFAFTDPASTAKALADATKGNEFVKVKGGFMAGQKLSAAQVKSLADMPPLPVMRAQLLGMLQAPAGKLVRTIAEPARGLAAVVKAFSRRPRLRRNISRVGAAHPATTVVPNKKIISTRST